MRPTLVHDSDPAHSKIPVMNLKSLLLSTSYVPDIVLSTMSYMDRNRTKENIPLWWFESSVLFGFAKFLAYDYVTLAQRNSKHPPLEDAVKPLDFTRQCFGNCGDPPILGTLSPCPQVPRMEAFTAGGEAQGGEEEPQASFSLPSSLVSSSVKQGNNLCPAASLGAGRMPGQTVALLQAAQGPGGPTQSLMKGCPSQGPCEYLRALLAVLSLLGPRPFVSPAVTPAPPLLPSTCRIKSPFLGLTLKVPASHPRLSSYCSPSPFALLLSLDAQGDLFPGPSA